MLTAIANLTELHLNLHLHPTLGMCPIFYYSSNMGHDPGSFPLQEQTDLLCQMAVLLL